MRTFTALAAMGFAGLFVLTFFFILHTIFSAIRRRHSERRQVMGPGGVWSTRIHWTHPKAGLGIAERIFRPGPETPEEENPPKERERFKLGDLASIGDIFDEGFLIIMGLLATVGLVVVGIVIVLLAVELAFFMLLFSILGGGRVLFRHPWSIEVVDPQGSSQLVEVEGLSATRETQLQIRQQIAAGTLRLIPRDTSV